MRIALIHLSDIHFKRAGNPVLSRVEEIVRAIDSTDHTVQLFVIAVSGDVAFSGREEEYAIAFDFLSAIKQSLLNLRHGLHVELLAVPGNHDCWLPEDEAKLRAVLVQGIIPSMEEPPVDQAMLNQVLKAQSAYRAFRDKLRPGAPWNGLNEVVMVKLDTVSIQFNLYNTAALSQNPELQGKLYVPVKHFEQAVSISKDVSLAVSIFHHSYIWIESNIAMEFRRHVENTSDVALCGHQHYPHDFYKENNTGARILYVDGGALQDEKFAQTSFFQALLFDLAAAQQRSVRFRFSKDIYRVVEDTNWRNISLTRKYRREFRTTEQFQTVLDDPGVTIRHSVKGILNLPDIYIISELTVRPAGPKTQTRDVLSADVLAYGKRVTKAIFQAPSFAGKTSLAKTLFTEILRTGEQVPLLLKGNSIDSSNEQNITSILEKAFRHEYGSEMMEEFNQLLLGEKTLIIDDWHRSRLNPDGRTAFLEIAGHNFGRVLLFTDELYQVRELVSKSASTILDYDHVTIREFRSSQRGRLIDKWLTMGREHTADQRKLNRQIEEKERLVQSLIGKNTLPSLPFILLCILQADDEGKADSAEAGSFGYLYEVVVTVALSATTGGKMQLEKKYNFLSRLAYTMFKSGLSALRRSRVKEVAAEYSRSLLVSVDIDAMLTDLENARVLVNLEGNYSFAYSHLFCYFVARYYKENLSRDASLRPELEHITDTVSSDKNAAVLMFVVYFARDSADVVTRLVANANKIYAGLAEADLGSDVAFLNQLSDEPDIRVPREEVDIAKSREQRRELQDRVSRSAESIAERADKEHVYNDSLSDADKFDLAYKHIGLLGQVIRNFPGSLPGPDKLAILKSTYKLGLRLLRTLLQLLESSIGAYRGILNEALGPRVAAQEEKMRRIVDAFVLLLSRICSLMVITRISSSVGVEDLEEAYRETLRQVGMTNATSLIDIAIKLGHFDDFPETQVRELHDLLKKNPFALTILSDLVTARMMKFDMERRTRQSMADLFHLKSNDPRLIDPSQKKD